MLCYERRSGLGTREAPDGTWRIGGSGQLLVGPSDRLSVIYILCGCGFVYYVKVVLILHILNILLNVHTRDKFRNGLLTTVFVLQYSQL